VVAGGTGAAGRTLVNWLLQADIRVVVLSRDEYKQAQLKQAYPNVSCYLADLRDLEQLQEVFEHINRYLGCPVYLFNCAAFKRVPEGELAALEFVKTNILGASNLLRVWKKYNPAAAARQAIFISSDKASAPLTVYGATKLITERYWARSGYVAVRYGNVIDSRGSVLDIFKRIAAAGERAPITHPAATRFVMTVRQAINFVLKIHALAERPGTYVPTDLKAVNILDLAKEIWQPKPDTNWYRVIGFRGYEKLHETLVSRPELAFTYTTDIDNVAYIGMYPNSKWRLYGRPIASNTAESISADELKQLAALEAIHENY